jgi:hypothetical protein
MHRLRLGALRPFSTMLYVQAPDGFSARDGSSPHQSTISASAMISGGSGHFVPG